MEAIIEKIKHYKIIVICTGLGLLVGGFFLQKPAPQTPVTRNEFAGRSCSCCQGFIDRKGSEEGSNGRTP